MSIGIQMEISNRQWCIEVWNSAEKSGFFCRSTVDLQVIPLSVVITGVEVNESTGGVLES